LDVYSRIATNDDVINGSILEFTGNRAFKRYYKENGSPKAKILSAEQSNTSVTYDNKFFLKIYRKVDFAINPDLEITHFLTEHADFKHIPAYAGSIIWKKGDRSMVIGMMQEMVESASDAWTYMLDRIADYNERILAKDKFSMRGPELKGSLTRPVHYNDIPPAMKELLEASVAERARLLGIRTAEMHIALASGNDIPDFKPEEFSLHYQRSLFSSFQTLVRSTFQNQSRNLKKIPEELRAEAEQVLGMKDEILQEFKKIYRKKIDAVKIRIHGDYHLGQVLFTGKDFIILDFEGEPARSYSERRLKRSPLRDVAGMLRSFHYAAYGGLFLNERVRKEDLPNLLPFAEQWYHYVSGFFMQAYLETANGRGFLPEEYEDLDTMLQTYLLEKAIYELNYELNNRPDWILIPLRGIKAIMEKARPELKKTK
jgi:maltose alpha-D-glucosyltransferase/alpha-amylase